MPRLRLGSERQLGDDCALACQCLVQPAIFFGVDDIDATADDSDAAGLERAQMRRGIDAAGEARDDDDPALPECGGEVAAETPAAGRSVARPHYGDDRLGQQFGPPENGQDRRRVLDRHKRARVDRLAPADQPRPESLQCGKLSLRIGARDRDHGLGTLAAAGELRQHLDRCPR